MAYSYDQTLPNDKKKKKTVPCKNMNETKEHTRWKNSDVKYYIVYHSIYMKFLKNAKP